MKYPFVLSAFADEAGSSLTEQISAMAENGVSGLEIRGIDGRNVTELSLAEAKEIRSRLEAQGLSVWSIGSPIGKINITDCFAPHLDLYKHTLELADVLGAKAFRLFSFFMPKEEDPEIYRDEVLERMSHFAEEARGMDLMICHENEKGIYGDIAPRCRTIYEALPDIGAIFDPANFIQSGQDTMEAWEMLGKYVKYMHIKDCYADGSVVPAGKGIGNLPVILEAFGAQGGRVLTLEPHLTVFKGLSDLEREGERSAVGGFAYPSPRAAFDAAVVSLRAIIA